MTALHHAGPGEAFHVATRLLTRRPWTATLATLVLLLDATASLATPAGIGLLVDAVSGPGNRRDFMVAIFLLVCAGIVQGITTGAAAMLLTRTTEPALADLREEALTVAVTLNPEQLERAGIGDVTARLTGDIERLAEAAGGTIAAFVSSGLAIVLTMFGLVALDLRFAVVGVLVIPLEIMTVRWYRRRSGRVYRRVREADGELHQELLTTLDGLDTVRAFHDETVRYRAIERRSNVARRLTLAAQRIASRFYGRLNVAEFVGLAAVLTIGFVLVAHGDATVGVVTTGALFFTRLFDPLNTVLGLADTLQQAAASLGRIVGLAHTHSTQPRNDSDTDLRMSAVTLVYDGERPALTDVSLHVTAGSHVAVVGPSGAGKTSLGRIAAGVASPTTGTLAAPNDVVLIDQSPYVFAGTLADNLRLVAPSASEGTMLAALQTAGFTPQLDLDAPLSARRLTAADIQHLALARLVLRDPALVVLDEATADAGSAAAVALERATERVIVGRTAIIIAHRLTQAVTADRILVLSAGRIVEDGTHAELLARNATYARLWRAWSTTRAAAH